MEQTILERATYWATSNAFDAATKKEIAQLIESKNEKELNNRFYRDLEFGTGGMRGIMGAGTAYMNIYNIRKASMAVATYLREVHGDHKELKIAMSHDSRHNGPEFVRAAAEVFATFGIKSLITKQMRPVPMLSFMVKHFKCDAGICVTASHNPPAYNGYKVYWSTGAQLVPPHDKKIVENYGKISDYSSIKYMSYEIAQEKGLIQLIGQELDDAYFAKVKALSMRNEGRKDFSISYSPIHGTGIYAVPRALKEFGFENVHIVAEQSEPNGSFPTVKSPNPEEPEALTMALKLAKEKKADIVLATDPDTDRIAVITRENGEYVSFNGNQLGCLLNDYMLSGMKAKNVLPQDGMVVKTIVTTELQKDIADYYGVACFDTLTGFKWIAELIHNFENGSLKPYRHFICGGEESYGFMAGDFVRDKDAVIGCAIASEMVAWHKSQGRTLTQALDDIFLRHGVYQEDLHTVTLPGKEGADQIKKMMTELRNHPPMTIDGKKVLELRDIKTGEVKIPQNGQFAKKESLNLPSSDVLQFILQDHVKVSVRPSGTEPKIKFYISVKIPSVSATDLGAAKEKAWAMCQQAKAAFVNLVQEKV